MACHSKSSPALLTHPYLSALLGVVPVLFWNFRRTTYHSGRGPQCGFISTFNQRTWVLLQLWCALKSPGILLKCSLRSKIQKSAWDSALLTISLMIPCCRSWDYTLTSKPFEHGLWNFRGKQYHGAASLKHKLLNHAPRPRVSHSIDLGWGLRICILNKFPGDAAASVPR